MQQNSINTRKMNEHKRLLFTYEEMRFNNSRLCSVAEKCYYSLRFFLSFYFTILIVLIQARKMVDLLHGDSSRPNVLTPTSKATRVTDKFESLVFIQETNTFSGVPSRVLLCLLGLIWVTCHNSTPCKEVQEREYLAKRSRSFIIGLKNNLFFRTGHMTTLHEIRMLLTQRKGKLASKWAMNSVSQSYKIQLLLLVLLNFLTSIYIFWLFLSKRCPLIYSYFFYKHLVNGTQRQLK